MISAGKKCFNKAHTTGWPFVLCPKTDSKWRHITASDAYEEKKIGLFKTNEGK